MRTIELLVLTVFILSATARAKAGHAVQSRPVPLQIPMTQSPPSAPIVEAKPKFAEPAVSGNDTFQSIMKQILKTVKNGGRAPGIGMDGTLIIGDNPACWARSGTYFETELKFNNALTLDFGDIVADPTTTIGMQAGQKDLVAHIATTVQDVNAGCSYEVAGNFNLESANGVEEPSSLFLRFYTGMTEDFAVLRLQKFNARFYPVKKQNKTTTEYEMELQCVASQAIGDYQNLAEYKNFQTCLLRLVDGRLHVTLKSAQELLQMQKK